MSTIRLWRYVLALLFACLSLSAAATPRLITSGSGDTLKLMGVRDILVNNVAYNVSFAHGECYDFRGSDCITLNNIPFARNESAARAAEAALSAAVFGSGNQFSHQPLRINGCLAADECNLETAFDKAFSCDCFARNMYLSISADPATPDRIYDSIISMSTKYSPNYTYADWSPVPVPEPTGWAMYGAGLLALTGVARRRYVDKKKA